MFTFYVIILLQFLFRPSDGLCLVLHESPWYSLNLLQQMILNTGITVNLLNASTAMLVSQQY